MIRQISNKIELAAAISLIWETFLQFEAPDFIENDEIVNSLEVFGAYDNDELKGVIATKENRKHICCFFVKAEYHKQGIGRKLWEYVLDSSNHSEYTVNSSPYAVPVYHKLGFIDMDSEQLSDGMRFTPMKFIR